MAVQKSYHTIRCPACGRSVKAVAWNGVVYGWCAVKGELVRVQVKVK